MKKESVSPLLLLLVLALGCGVLPSATLESETAKTNPNPVIDDAELFLNNEPMGRISDIGRKPKTLSGAQPLTLDGRLFEVVKQREANGVFLVGTNEIAAGVYLIVEPALSIGAVARIYGAIQSAGASPLNLRLPVPEVGKKAAHPNPLFLIVTTGRVPATTDLPALLPESDREHRFTYNVNFDTALEPNEVDLKRQTGSLEISADEKFFINSGSGSAVDQRPLEAPALRRVAENLVEKPGGVPVIVSDRASYAALLRLLNSVKPATPIRVIVRRTAASD